MKTLIFCAAALFFANAFSQDEFQIDDCADRLVVPRQILDSRVVVFGEVHGTNEAPRFAGQFVCVLAAIGRDVVLALEIPDGSTPNITDYMMSDSADAYTPDPNDATFWGRVTQDGRSSLAVSELISYSKTLKNRGMRIDVYPYDRGISSGATRDSSMAESLQELLADKPNVQVVVLTGNIHARKTQGMPFNSNNSDFLPMTRLLNDFDPVSLDLAHSGGTAWVCTSSGCGETVLQPAKSQDVPEPGILFNDDDDAFDGAYYVGKVTASRPAVE